MSAENERWAITVEHVLGKCSCLPAYKAIPRADPSCAACNYGEELAEALDAASSRAFADAVERAAKVVEAWLQTRSCPCAGSFLVDGIRSLAPAGKAEPKCARCGGAGTVGYSDDEVTCPDCAGKADGR